MNKNKCIIYLSLKMKIKEELNINCHYLQFPEKKSVENDQRKYLNLEETKENSQHEFAKNECKKLFSRGKAVGVILVTI